MRSFLDPGVGKRRWSFQTAGNESGQRFAVRCPEGEVQLRLVDVALENPAIQDRDFDHAQIGELRVVIADFQVLLELGG